MRAEESPDQEEEVGSQEAQRATLVAPMAGGEMAEPMPSQIEQVVVAVLVDTTQKVVMETMKQAVVVPRPAMAVVVVVETVLSALALTALVAVV